MLPPHSANVRLLSSRRATTPPNLLCSTLQRVIISQRIADHITHRLSMRCPTQEAMKHAALLERDSCMLFYDRSCRTPPRFPGGNRVSLEISCCLSQDYMSLQPVFLILRPPLKASTSCSARVTPRQFAFSRQSTRSSCFGSQQWGPLLWGC